MLPSPFAVEDIVLHHTSAHAGAPAARTAPPQLPATSAPGPVWRQNPARIAESREWPAILVVEAEPVLAPTLAELLDALRLRLVRVADATALAEALRSEAPLGVLAHMPRGHGGAAPEVHRALDEVARADPGLPVMVVTDPPATAVRNAGDLGERPLVNLVWLPRPPALRMVIEFLCMAERRRGVPGLMQG